MTRALPDDDVAVEAFSVIREAMVRTETAGIARLTMNNRERWIAVQPRGKGILLMTLKYPYEVRDENVVWERIDDEKPDAEAVKAMEEVMDEMADPKQFNDHYQNAVAKVLKEKQGPQGATDAHRRREGFFRNKGSQPHGNASQGHRSRKGREAPQGWEQNPRGEREDPRRIVEDHGRRQTEQRRAGPQPGFRRVSLM